MKVNHAQEERALPIGWVRVAVKDIYKIIGGGTPSTGVEEYWQGEIPWISSADIYGPKDIRPRRNITRDAIENSATNLVPAESLIVVTRVGLGKVALTTAPICFSQDSQALVGNHHLIFPDYAIHYLSQAVSVFKYQSRGTTIAGVTKKQLADLPFLLPPLPEQHRIVDVIETQFTRLDAAVAALQRVKANLARYKASVLKAACEGRLVPTAAELVGSVGAGLVPALVPAPEEGNHKGCPYDYPDQGYPYDYPDQGCPYEPADALLRRILAERRARWEAENPGKRYTEPQGPDTSDLPELPEGWCWASLPQLGELNRGKSKHRPRNDERLFGGPYPFIQTGEVREVDGVITTYTQTYSEFGLAQSRLWPKGTLCITIAANIAETAILGFEGCFPDSVVGFIAEQGIDLRFVEYFMRTAKEDLERYAPATAQKNINLRTLQGVAVPLPPLAEQQRIVAEVERRLSVVAEIEAAVDANLARAERLRQAILKRAFEGRLVPQDPDDEPASALLERIRHIT